MSIGWNRPGTHAVTNLEKKINILKKTGAIPEQIEVLRNHVLGIAGHTQSSSAPPALPPKEPLLLTSGEKPEDSPIGEDVASNAPK